MHIKYIIKQGVKIVMVFFTHIDIILYICFYKFSMLLLVFVASFFFFYPKCVQTFIDKAREWWNFWFAREKSSSSRNNYVNKSKEKTEVTTKMIKNYYPECNNVFILISLFNFFNKYYFLNINHLLLYQFLKLYTMLHGLR